MSAAWAAVLVAVIMAAAALGRELITRGQRDGKIDACLEQLTRISEDHETRIRLIEASAGRTPLGRLPGSPLQ